MAKDHRSILDMLLLELLTINGKTCETVLDIKGRVIPSSVYVEPMDQRYFLHLLETLLALLQCTGHSLLKSMQATMLQRCSHPNVFNLAQTCKLKSYNLGVV